MFIPCSPLRVQSSIAKTCPDGKVKVTLLFLLVIMVTIIRGIISNMVITVAKRAMTTLALRLRLWTAATGCWSPGADQNVTDPHARRFQILQSIIIFMVNSLPFLAMIKTSHTGLPPSASTYLRIRLHTWLQFGEDSLKVTAIAGALASKNVEGLLLIMSFSVAH